MIISNPNSNAPGNDFMNIRLDDSADWLEYPV